MQASMYFHVPTFMTAKYFATEASWTGSTPFKFSVDTDGYDALAAPPGGGAAAAGAAPRCDTSAAGSCAPADGCAVFAFERSIFGPKASMCASGAGMDIKEDVSVVVASLAVALVVELLVGLLVVSVRDAWRAEGERRPSVRPWWT